MEKSCFVERFQAAGWNIYIREDDDDDSPSNSATTSRLSQELLISLAETVNTILSGMLHDSVLYLLPTLSCADADSIDRCLDSLNIRPSFLASSPASPTVGTSVCIAPPTMGVAVDPSVPTAPASEDEDRLVAAGEYVAYRSTEVLVYARVEEDLGGTIFMLNIGNGQNGIIASREDIFVFTRH